MSLRLSGGRRLRSPPGSRARPTAARVRLAVFNLLAAELPGCRWLDLCCGSGVMACEALQLGAAEVVAVERDRRIAAVARANLAVVAAAMSAPAGATDEPGEAQLAGPTVTVVSDEVLRWLGRRGRIGAGEDPAHLESFDLIYTDPPYASGLYGGIAAAVAAGGWLRPTGKMLWECSSDAVPAVPHGWQVLDVRRYGGSSLVVLRLDAPGQ